MHERRETDACVQTKPRAIGAAISRAVNDSQVGLSMPVRS